MQVDLVQIILITGGWSGALMGLALHLHNRRVGQTQKLADRIDVAEARAAADHRALALQVSDISRTVAEHYVRKDDMMPMLRDIKADVLAGNHSIDDVSKRVDQLYLSVEWRKGTR